MTVESDLIVHLEYSFVVMVKWVFTDVRNADHMWGYLAESWLQSPAQDLQAF